MDLDHSFDWHGIRFTLKSLLVIIVGVLLAWYGTPYIYSVPTVPIPVTQAAHSMASTVTPLFSTTTPQRVINQLTIVQAVPHAGKFVVADLVKMQLFLYQDGKAVDTFPILTKGRPGSSFETPSGFYTILTKEENHLNRVHEVTMPYSMQFYGNYFIHGWPQFLDGTPVPTDYSGGCIRLGTADAAKVFAFAGVGTRLFVYDATPQAQLSSLALGELPIPPVSAASYLVADVDTGDVLLEHDAQTPRPIASVTKLMTALVANETILEENQVTLPQSLLTHASSTPSTPARFAVRDLFYPLLMESNNHVADAIAHYYGTKGFVGWMNATAKALDMASTTYADPSGISPDNISTPDDLYRLAVYLTTKKSFVWKITRTPTKTLVTDSGYTFTFHNFNLFSDQPSFIGGKVGKTGQAGETMVSVFSTSVNGTTRRVAIVVLKSEDYTKDTIALQTWYTRAVALGAKSSQPACATCALPHYRVIKL